MSNHRASRLSPLRSYRDFVARQRDDSDPGTYARRYAEYRRGYARELVERFFELQTDYEWFRDHYDPLALAERMKRRRERALRNALAFSKEAICLDDDNKEMKEIEIAERASLDPLPELEEENNEDLSFESSLHMIPGHNARRIVMLPNIPPSTTRKALDSALSTCIDEKGQEDDDIISFRLLQSDASRRRREGFDYEAWLVFESDEKAAEVENLLSGVTLDLPVPAGIAMSAAPWNPQTLMTKEELQALRRERAAKMRGKECLDFEPLRVRPKRPLLIASTVTIDDFGRRGNAPRYPRPLCPSPILSSRPRIISDAKIATKLAKIFDEKAKIPVEHRFEAVINQNSLVAKCAKARLDVAAAYLRRVHYFLYYSATFFRDELEILKADALWYTRHTPAEASYQDDDTLLLVPDDDDETGQTQTQAEQDDDDIAKQKIQAPEDERSMTKSQGPAEEEEERMNEEASAASENKNKDGAQNAVDTGNDMQVDAVNDADPAIYAMDSSLRRKLFKRPITTNDFGALAKQARDHCICYHLDLSTAWNELVEDEENEIKDATDEYMQSHIIAEDHGRARCAYEWCHKLFKSEEFLGKHLMNRHADYFEAWLGLTRRSYMWKLYDADEYKPLPPVRATDSGLEVDPNEMLHDASAEARPGGRGSRGYGRGYGGRLGRGGGRGEHYYQRGGPPRDSFPPQRGPPRSEESSQNDPRRLANYADVDAPKRKALDLDFGVLLPPPPSKKKKKSTTRRSSTASAASSNINTDTTTPAK